MRKCQIYILSLGKTKVALSNLNYNVCINFGVLNYCTLSPVRLFFDELSITTSCCFGEIRPSIAYLFRSSVVEEGIARSVHYRNSDKRILLRSIVYFADTNIRSAQE